MQVYPLFPAFKALLTARLNDAERSRLRPPLTPLLAEQAAKLIDELRRYDFPLAAWAYVVLSPQQSDIAKVPSAKHGAWSALAYVGFEAEEFSRSQFLCNQPKD